MVSNQAFWSVFLTDVSLDKKEVTTPEVIMYIPGISVSL